MTKKDTILIAVVINAGLLAILFAAAVIYDTDKLDEPSQLDKAAVVLSQPPEMHGIAANQPIAGDEVDQVLRFYSQPDENRSIALERPIESFSVPEPLVSSLSFKEEETAPPPKTISPTATQDEYVEVTVKKGDSLDKIARANGTSVSAIKKASQLESERLSIGQVLKVPLKKEKPKPIVKKVENEPADAVYYTLKSGDSPWKIAKQFNVTADEILSLNNLDEGKARNLKTGDRIRVK